MAISRNLAMKDINHIPFGSEGQIDPREAQAKSVEARKANNIKAKILEAKGTKAVEALLSIAYDKALEGDKDMLKYMIDQLEGRAVNTTELTGKDGSELKAAGAVVILGDNGRDKGPGGSAK